MQDVAKTVIWSKGHAMVKSLVAIVLVCCAVVASAADGATGLPRVPAIKTVVIGQNAGWSDSVSSDEPREACADFVLTKADVRRFFRVARRATDREYHHDLDMSRCHANGQAVLRDGRIAMWEIDRMRRGALWLADGTIFYFYCGKCRSKKYYEDCDIECIHAS